MTSISAFEKQRLLKSIAKDLDTFLALCAASLLVRLSYKLAVTGDTVFEIRYRHRQDIDKFNGALEREADENILTEKWLLPHHLDDRPLLALPVELRIVDLLPRAKIQPAVGHGDDDLMVQKKIL
jgi:hypothetical protein